MSTVDTHPAHSFARRAPPHRIIIARGDAVRSFTVRPWLVGTLAVIAVAFAVLYLAATGYLVFRDDLLAASIARQSRMQTAYEDRIASLRADIDRLTSRQLLNQEEVEARMDKLLGRQAALDTRQDIIASLSQAMRRAGLAPAEPSEAAAESDAGEAAPKKADINTSSLMPSIFGPAADPPAGPLAEMDEVATSLDALAREQVAYVDAVADKVATGNDKIAAALKRIGHEAPASHSGAADGIGGPFVGLDEDADPETFRAGVALVSGEIERFAAIRRFATQLPLARPLPGAAITSRFGTRMDPFLGKPAMHTGVDFRAAVGLPITATAGGTVITAGNGGGYGKMVEIDHGHGVTTRYAHLSEIDVKVGQVISKGTVIGKAGSTGRSTGPHLHYEVRVDGAAINPMTYIAAGKEILPLL
jgi:murein DD-endopeptidase MepM/ murein hydrolase activator NlpD